MQCLDCLGSRNLATLTHTAVILIRLFKISLLKEIILLISLSFAPEVNHEWKCTWACRSPALEVFKMLLLRMRAHMDPVSVYYARYAADARWSILAFLSRLRIDRITARPVSVRCKSIAGSHNFTRPICSTINLVLLGLLDRMLYSSASLRALEDRANAEKSSIDSIFITIVQTN